MDGSCAEDAGEYHSNPTVRSLLARVLAVATAQGRAQRVKMSAVRQKHQDIGEAGVSAKEAANNIENLARPEALEEVNKNSAALGLTL